MAEHCPLKRCATPEDVARVVAFLSSDDGGWVNGMLSITYTVVIPHYANSLGTGQVITISGGSSQ